MSSLVLLNVGENRLSGSLPTHMCSSCKLNRLQLYRNQFQGEVNLSGIIQFQIPSNSFTGDIPINLVKFQTRFKYLERFKYYFKASNLHNLSLSNNKLDGPLSTSFSELNGLVYLDLSRNNLCGPIPKSFEELTYVNYFNVSFNDLSGEIPDGGACEIPSWEIKVCMGHRDSKWMDVKGACTDLEERPGF